MFKLLTVISCLIPAATASAQNITYEYDGIDRQYRIHIPDQLQENSPLVVVLHGYGGSNNEMQNNYGWTELSDEEGFVVVFPNGTRDQSNSRFWDVNYAFHQNLDVDDDGFLSSLAIYLQGQYGLDPQRTFVTGFSNGAEMCFQLACNRPETFTAFAPVIGMMLDSLFESCNPTIVRPIISMNGTADNVTLYNGDPNNTGGWGAYKSIPDTMTFWQDLLEVPNITRTFLPDTSPSDGSTVRLDVYTSADHPRSLWYYLIIGGGHDWPGRSGNMDIDATQEVWNFFKTIDACTDCIIDCNDNGIADAEDISNSSSEDCDSNGRPDECDISNGGDSNDDGILDTCQIECGDAISETLNGIGTSEISYTVEFSGPVNQFSAGLFFTNAGDQTWAGDVLIGVTSPDGQTVEFGGYDYSFNYENIGDFSSIYDTVDNGAYSPEDFLSPTLLTGDGTWTIQIANGFEDSIGGEWAVDLTLCRLGDGGDPPCDGDPDLNSNGCVGGEDIGLLLTVWNNPNATFGDLNCDGIVDGADFGIVLSGWQSCP